MLVLTRKTGERILIDGTITVTVLQTRGGKVRIGIEAPLDVDIQREELVGRKSFEELFEPVACEAAPV